MSTAYNLKDATLIVTRALPNGSATVNSTSIDAKRTASGVFLADVEVDIQAPAVTTGMLADGSTIIYSLQDSADNSSFAAIQTALITQTGAAGAGAAATSARTKLPSTVRRYIRLSIVKNVAGDATSVSATFQLVF
ncbi:MAG: hypothetical protein FJ272_21330 [Planctomycetes bacterium]|nr:hypothetical protein [Planctomycetota bacterium]